MARQVTVGECEICLAPEFLEELNAIEDGDDLIIICFDCFKVFYPALLAKIVAEIDSEVWIVDGFRGTC